jgi:Oxidoreductase FAD-binding domain
VSAMLRTGARSKVTHSVRPIVWKTQTRTAVFRHGRMVQPSEPGLPPPKPITWGGRAPAGLRVIAVGSTLLAFYFTYWTSPEKTSERPPDLNLRTFTRAVIHSVTHDPPKLGSKPDCMVVRMTIPQQFLPKDDSHLANAIHHIYIRDDDMQVERPYTPLYGIGADGKIVLWVKKYPGGEVSNWISRRKRNENVGVRGPILQWDWRSGPWDEIIMVRALSSPQIVLD